MSETKIELVPSVGQQLFKHPDYTVPLTLAEVLTDFLQRIERQESAYVSIDAEIKYEERS